MDDNRQSNNVYHLQKKIIELTQQYYKAIKDNISFENLKTIFIKRKKLQRELSELEKRNENKFDSENNAREIDSNLKVNEGLSIWE
jgi:hypothetical protein